jgi:hypothetical protein
LCPGAPYAADSSVCQECAAPPVIMQWRSPANIQSSDWPFAPMKSSAAFHSAGSESPRSQSPSSSHRPCAAMRRKYLSVWHVAGAQDMDHILEARECSVNVRFEGRRRNWGVGRVIAGSAGFGGEAEILCSTRAVPVLTRSCPGPASQRAISEWQLNLRYRRERGAYLRITDRASPGRW